MDWLTKALRSAVFSSSPATTELPPEALMTVDKMLYYEVRYLEIMRIYKKLFVMAVIYVIVGVGIAGVSCAEQVLV